MSYVHVTTSERVKIETYLELGFSVRKIAGRLGRQTFGRRELDSVVSDRGKSKACVATFVKRKSRFYLTVSTENRSAWQRESNENTNGLLRRSLALNFMHTLDHVLRPGRNLIRKTPKKDSPGAVTGTVSRFFTD